MQTEKYVSNIPLQQFGIVYIYMEIRILKLKYNEKPSSDIQVRGSNSNIT